MAKKQYDKKMFRLISILRHLYEGKSVRCLDLADEFNVTVRTMQRDINMLCECGFPIIFDEGSYFYKSHGKEFMPEMPEAINIHSAARMQKRLRTCMSEQYDEGTGLLEVRMRGAKGDDSFTLQKGTYDSEADNFVLCLDFFMCTHNIISVLDCACFLEMYLHSPAYIFEEPVIWTKPLRWINDITKHTDGYILWHDQLELILGGIELNKGNVITLRKALNVQKAEAWECIEGQCIDGVSVGDILRKGYRQERFITGSPLMQPALILHRFINKKVLNG